MAILDQAVNPPVDESNVSPEEQEIYDTIVANAQNIIYDKESGTNILNMIQSAESPAEGVAQATVVIGDQLVSQAESQGMAIPEDVLSAASEEVVEMVFELAEASNLIPEVTEDDMFTALTKTMQLWGEMHPERFDAQQASVDLQGLNKADVAGIFQQLGA